jgi:hypothetical protein
MTEAKGSNPPGAAAICSRRIFSRAVTGKKKWRIV